jgi:hypothetical protein
LNAAKSPGFEPAGIPTYARPEKISTIFSDFPKIRAHFLKMSPYFREIFLDAVIDIKYRREPGKNQFLRRKSRSAAPIQQSQTSKPDGLLSC